MSEALVKSTHRTTYAQIIRREMNAASKSTGQNLSIRELARQLGYSYEHVRKLVNGEPILSRPFSDKISQFFRLDAETMWEVAQHDKAAKKFGHLVAQPLPDVRLAELWPLLTSGERQTILSIAEAFARGREAQETDSADTQKLLSEAQMTLQRDPFSVGVRRVQVAGAWVNQTSFGVTCAGG